MIERVPPTHCPECMNRIDAIGDLKDEANGKGPMPGDPIACLRCGAVMTIDMQRRIRGFTEKEMDELIRDHETMIELAYRVRQIHFLRQAN